jgi:putative tryptophan/tyrosine transport system substrate-binding protein
MMDRRAFISGITGGLLAAPLVAEAQQAGKVWRIGLFHVGLDHVPPSLDGLREGLKTLGYESGTVPASMVSSVMEGKNIRLDWRNLPDEAAAHETAKEFVRQRVDLIVAFENQTVRAAKAATSEIPIVFLHVTDPLADGFVKSLAHPGGNVTGMSGYLDLTPKHLGLFKELVPRLRQVLVLIDPDDPTVPRLINEARHAAAALRLQLVEREAKTQPDLEQVFGSLKPGEVEAVFPISQILQSKFTALLIRLAAKKRLPLWTHRKEWVEQGALFAYAPDYVAVGRDAAGYVDKILRGAKPSDLPVEQMSRLALVINLKTAKTLGLTIPPSLLQRADRVIE